MVIIGTARLMASTITTTCTARPSRTRRSWNGEGGGRASGESVFERI